LAAPPEPDPDLDAWLRAGAGADEPCEKVVSTSISWVYLYPSRVLKLKKPVDFGFLDFTTPDKRRWAAERELAFNRATAPDIYRAVLPVVRAGDGFRLGGAGEPAVDWLLEMARFDESCVLSERPEAVGGDFAESLGREIARFHAAAQVSQRTGGIDKVGVSNAGHLRAFAEVLGPAEVAALVEATAAEAARRRSLLAARQAAGMVRGCHGDLHLGNILMQDGRAVLFDCIEFSDAYREIDVLYDLAFLLMDLWFRGRGEAASRALNGWLDEAARTFGDAAYTGLAALPLFQSVRAAVRAHVSAHAGDAETARAYVAAARAHLAPAPARLFAVGGLSGSGKTTFARALAPLVGRAPGAVVLRSDEIRKRLWGRAPTDRLPPQAYAAGESGRVYGEMLRLAGLALAAGCAVVLDAVFLKPDERAAAEALARAAGVRFTGVWLEAPADTLRARVAARTSDASDADVKVLERQLALDPGAVGWTVKGGDLAAAARAAAAEPA
jgi:aminoglycoside phosphotransferase family enzyme/predicted kinase